MAVYPAEKVKNRRPSAGEQVVSSLVMALLVCIAVSLLVVQSRYSPNEWRAAPGGSDASGALLTAQGPSPPASSAPIAGVVPLSPPEMYDSISLSDKINGKAELYLAAGFARLETQRFALTDNPGQWMERYLYDMGQHANAFSVFSAQRRPGAQRVDISDNAYRSANGLFFVHGRYYVEIVGAAVSDDLQTGMRNLADAFVREHPVKQEVLSEQALFPSEQQTENSLALASAHAFGIDGLDHVYTAHYQQGEADAIVFLSRRSTPDEANRLADLFASFFLEYGGEERPGPAELQGSRVISIFDSFEVVLVRGNYLMGVHEATDLAFALELAGRMRQNVEESIHAAEK